MKTLSWSMAAGLAVSILSSISFAQSRPVAVRSPEVQADRQVTFRILATEAKAVTINGDWMPPSTQTPLVKDDHGVWSVTLGPLASGISIYNFTVDGLAIADPVNPKMKLRAERPPACWKFRATAPSCGKFKMCRTARSKSITFAPRPLVIKLAKFAFIRRLDTTPIGSTKYPSVVFAAWQQRHGRRLDRSRSREHDSRQLNRAEESRSP